MLRQAIVYSFSSSYLTILIEFASVLVVVRLLSPEEMGVYAISASFVAILRVLRDFGVSQYIVQEPNLKREHLRAAISITACFGFTFALLIYFVVAPLSAQVYESAGVGQVLEVLAFSFLLFPFGAIPMAHMRRTLNFKSRFKVEICAALAKSTTAISCAIYGLGYMSLAWASIAEAVTIVAVASIVRPSGLPHAPGLRGIRHVFHTSWRLAGGGFVQYVGAAAPPLILGKVLGLHSVGLFDRGTATINTFNHMISNSVDTLVLPYFSSSKRAGSSLKNEYLKANSLVTGIAWPFFIFLSFNAAEVIRILYGDAWVSAAPIVVWLAYAQILGFSCYLYEQFIIAQGRAGAFLKLQGFLTPVTIILILVAAPDGIERVAQAFILIASIRFVVVAYFLYNVDKISLLELAQSNSASIYAALIVWMICWGSSSLVILDDVSSLLHLVFEAIVVFTAWLVSMFIFRHPLASEIRRGVNYLRSRG